MANADASYRPENRKVRYLALFFGNKYRVYHYSLTGLGNHDAVFVGRAPSLVLRDKALPKNPFSLYSYARIRLRVPAVTAVEQRLGVDPEPGSTTVFLG
jgi:hypothetical protein